MNVPDFSKYDETQLEQILSRIDRKRFPERVREIEARLEAFRLASSTESRAQKATEIEQQTGGREAPARCGYGYLVLCC